MLRAVCLLGLVLSLAACGGGDADEDAGPSSPNSATATIAASAATAASTEGATTTESPAGTAPDGVPPMEDPNFPDVYASLSGGSSAEADTGEDGNGAPGRARITIENVRDSAEPVSSFYEVQSGNRLWVADVTVESIGGGTIPLTEWTLGTTDGAEYEPVFGTDIGGDFLFFELANGESEEAALVFEIPADATVAWLLADPNIYVGRNIIFTP